MAASSRSVGNLFNKWKVSRKPLQRWLQRKASTTTERAISNTEARRKRLEIFEEEQRHQLALITRVEKIEVKYLGLPEECTLKMNKDLSTPFNCAMHIQELLMTRSALALVNGEPWDMHRPLEEDCELTFLHFADEDPRPLNSAFWRSCSFILGHVLETAFQDKYFVQLCSFPPPNVSSGSFVYDADLNLGDHKLSQRELDCLGRIGLRLHYEDLRFERLKVTAEKAEEMFADNRFKLQQIPAIASKSKSGSTVTVYRMGDHVDMSSGPLIASTAQIGRFSVCTVHAIESRQLGKLSRVQGLAMPTQLNMHSWTYDNILRPRAAVLEYPIVKPFFFDKPLFLGMRRVTATVIG